MDSYGDAKVPLLDIDKNDQLNETVNIDLESVNELVGTNNRFLEAIEEEPEE